MSKRKLDNFGDLLPAQKRRADLQDNLKKHSLDSDEEDEIDESTYTLDENEIEGEEDDTPNPQDGVRLTAFNMKEELEEGHFDNNGHFIWKNEAEVRDNWLDNIDWQRIHTAKNASFKGDIKGLGDEDSDSDTEQIDSVKLYKEMLNFMKPKETINKTLRRLGGDTQKLSSVERLKRKKAGTLGTNEDVIKLTELANKLLTSSGNMDIYQETYEMISAKIHHEEKQNKTEPSLNMFDDDFECAEQKKLSDTAGPSAEGQGQAGEAGITLWEYKLKQDSEEILGPHTTEQMNKWMQEKHFESDIWVRKYKEQTRFYSSKRIDFELYL